MRDINWKRKEGVGKEVIKVKQWGQLAWGETFHYPPVAFKSRVAQRSQFKCSLEHARVSHGSNVWRNCNHVRRRWSEAAAGSCTRCEGWRGAHLIAGASRRPRAVVLQLGARVVCTAWLFKFVSITSSLRKHGRGCIFSNAVTWVILKLRFPPKK